MAKKKVAPRWACRGTKCHFSQARSQDESRDGAGFRVLLTFDSPRGEATKPFMAAPRWLKKTRAAAVLIALVCLAASVQGSRWAVWESMTAELAIALPQNDSAFATDERPQLLLAGGQGVEWPADYRLVTHLQGLEVQAEGHVMSAHAWRMWERTLLHSFLMLAHTVPSRI